LLADLPFGHGDESVVLGNDAGFGFLVIQFARAKCVSASWMKFAEPPYAPTSAGNQD